MVLRSLTYDVPLLSVLLSFDGKSRSYWMGKYPSGVRIYVTMGEGIFNKLYRRETINIVLEQQALWLVH